MTGRPRLIAVALACIVASAPVLADEVSEGFAAYQRGDYLAAYKLCLPWAQQGNGDAQMLIGLMYANGNGVDQSWPLAARWYQAAADQDQDVAENNLGQMYAAGRGVRRSYIQAARLYWQSADQGNPRAQYNLAVAFKEGQGVDQDAVKSYMWYTLSLKAKWDPVVHDKAGKERDELARSMTPAQISKAEADAADWKPDTTPSPWPPQKR